MRSPSGPHQGSRPLLVELSPIPKALAVIGLFTPDYQRLLGLDGPGRLQRLCALLASVADRGSLAGAAAALGISYRYAWGLLRQAEGQLGAPLLLRRVGGSAGGGAELTAAARELLSRYRRLQHEVEPQVANILTAADQPRLAPGDHAPPPDRPPVLMASTIGPVEVGLLDALEAAYPRATGQWVRHIAAGTGQALAIARAGSVDLVLSHAPDLEQAFLDDGYGTCRWPLMENDFVICGPAGDLADLRGNSDAVAAFRRLADVQATFVSRGDRSGTHLKEMALWQAAGVEPGPPWYRIFASGGRGTGATLTFAAGLGAYTLADRATFLVSAPGDMGILVAGGPELANRFSLITVNSRRFPHRHGAAVERFAAWATGPDGQAVISAFGADAYGEPLFRPVGTRDLRRRQVSAGGQNEELSQR